MPRNIQLSDFEKGQIIGMYYSGTTITFIAAALNHDRTTVSRFLTRYRERRNVATVLRSGRPSIITNTDERNLINATSQYRNMSLREILTDNGINVSRSTARRILHRHGIRGRIAAKKPGLTSRQAEIRLAWCNDHINWSINDWQKIIFSDEASVEIGGRSRTTIVWRMKGDRYKPQFTVPTFRSGRKSIMVWACFAGGEKGPLVFMKERNGAGAINARRYVEVLKEHLIPFRRELIARFGDEIIYQDDNAPIHMAQYTREWMRSENINRLQWPSQSPDLNPIENIWKILKDNVQQRRPPPRTYEALKAALQEEWERLDVSIFMNVINSMQNRMIQVIDNNGYSCSY